MKPRVNCFNQYVTKVLNNVKWVQNGLLSNYYTSNPTFLNFKTMMHIKPIISHPIKMNAMKKLAYAFVTLLLSVLFFGACTKVVTQSATHELKASQTTIVTGRLDTLTVSNVTPADLVKFTISPSNFGGMRADSAGHAYIYFNTPGTYIVTVVVNGGTPITLSIIAVAPAVVIPDPPADIDHSAHLPLTGDQITVMTHYQKGPITDSVYLWFSAMTSNKYPCGNSELKFTNALDASNNFSINFTDVEQFATCTAIASYIPTRKPIMFAQHTANPYMVNGTYPLVITLNGTTYTGSITITTTTITFNWIYTTGIIITPTVITR
jgi:hypothetical protein